MTTYQVSYITEYRDGRIETNDQHTRTFATRQQAVAHARHITHDAAESNGIFQSEWIEPFSTFFDPNDIEEIRITATLTAVTID